MKTHCRLIRRGVRNRAFYCVDTKTDKRASLQTGSEDEARQIIEAKNQAERQPLINLKIARAYDFIKAVIEEIRAKTKRGFR
jgi:predicted house-cleaning noncanonical NTP pyrophosphatase (MazG superfamily)